MQVAVSLLGEFKEICEANGDELFVLASETFEKYARELGIKYKLFKYPPSSFKHYWKVCKKLDRAAAEFNPDIVFTTFGPSYWTPKYPHLMGFGLGHLVYPDSPFWKMLSLKKCWIASLKMRYRKWYCRKNARYFWCETEDVRQRMGRFLGIPLKDIIVAGNTYNSFFNKFKDGEIHSVERKDKEFRLLSLGNSGPHKNLSLIKKVTHHLGICKVRFFVTQTAEEYKNMFFGCESYVENLGILPPEKCPDAYLQCDALFAPTVMECFTANYPEAMIMQRPILTSDLSFARGLCGDAALYFDPLSGESAAKAIIQLITNKELYAFLQKRGLEKVKTFFQHLKSVQRLFIIG